MIKLKFRRNFLQYLVITVIVVLLIVYIYILISCYRSASLGEKDAWIGDTMAGVTAPIIGLISILLLYLTLSEQHSFNQVQADQGQIQQRLAIDEQFKSTLFTLLEVQRHLASSLQVKDAENETYFFRYASIELQAIYKVLDSPKLPDLWEIQKAGSEQDDLLLAMGVDVVCGITDSKSQLAYKRNQAILSNNETIQRYSLIRSYFQTYKSYSPHQKIACGYWIFYQRHKEVGGYCRHLYQILKYIKRAEDSELSHHEKSLEEVKQDIRNKYNYYAQFVQAQMSFDELLLLFYNSYLFVKVQPLLKHYNILENLPKEHLLTEEHRQHSIYNHKLLPDSNEHFLNLDTLS